MDKHDDSLPCPRRQAPGAPLAVVIVALGLVVTAGCATAPAVAPASAATCAVPASAAPASAPPPAPTPAVARAVARPAYVRPVVPPLPADVLQPPAQGAVASKAQRKTRNDAKS